VTGNIAHTVWAEIQQASAYCSNDDDEGLLDKVEISVGNLLDLTGAYTRLCADFNKPSWLEGWRYRDHTD